MLTEVADGVLVHRSELLRNTTVVVRGHAGVLLVDAGVTGAELRCLAQDLRAAGDRVVAGFSTHPDWDHVLWHPDLGDAPRFGTARCAAAMRDLRSQPDWRTLVVRAAPPEIADDLPVDPFGLLTPLPAGATHVPWAGPPVRVVEHPAHSPGHAALLLEEQRVLVAGDMLSDVFVPMLDDVDSSDDPAGEYLVGLAVLKGLADHADVVVPGHGSVGDRDQLRARLALDRAYVEALRDGREIRDPRLDSPEPGWEWVSTIHEGQLETLAAWRAARGAS